MAKPDLSPSLRAVLEDLREIATDFARTDNEAIRDIIVLLNETLAS